MKLIFNTGQLACFRMHFIHQEADYTNYPNFFEDFENLVRSTHIPPRSGSVFFSIYHATDVLSKLINLHKL